MSLLEKLDLTLQGDSAKDEGDSAEDEDDVISFADALLKNKHLSEFSMICNTSINIFDAFSHTVCNSSSIMSTYNSNHILCDSVKKTLFEEVAAH